MAKTRVLVVEDSLTVRARLLEVIASDPTLEVVGEAGDGRAAIQLCERLRPDIVTLDMMLPVMTGLAATEFIMAHFPTPILIVSASTNRGELFRTYDALAAGGGGGLEKPRGDEHDGEWEGRYLSTIKLVSRIKVITHLRARLPGLGRATEPLAATAPARATDGPTARRLGAIGASTGGPGALVAILRGLPASFPLPVLIVLHINEPFGAAFAEWLDGQSEHRVSYARDGALIADGAGRVLMAPPDKHLVVAGSRLHLTSDPERHSCRPSVDVLFDAIAREMAPVTI